MSDYVIAIGGTGARFLETLIHLSAAGLNPAEEIVAVMLDPDEGNGNISRMSRILANYSICRGMLSQFIRDDALPIFKCKMISLGNWSPVGAQKKLESFFNFHGLSGDLRNLCKLFYTKREMEEIWDNGFKGRANLGAPVMANIKNSLNTYPWRDFISGTETIRGIKKDLQGGICNIFIVGSIFGATGASGFPTIAQILRKESKAEEGGEPWPNLQNLRIGGVLVLPYFCFSTLEGGDQGKKDQGNLCADSKNFLINTKSALLHYAHFWSGTSPYNRVYFVGDEFQHQNFGKFAVGGQEQENPLTYVDLIAASSFLHFGENCPPAGSPAQYFYTGRKDDEKISCGDIPCPNLREKSLIFSTFVFSYKKFIKPLIDHQEFDRKRNLIPWYIECFDKGELKKVQSQKAQQGGFFAYLEDFNRFIREIHAATGNGLKVELFQSQALIDEDFGELLPGTPDIKYRNDKFFEILCKGNWKKRGNPNGRLFSMLYKASDEFCRKYYNI